MVKRDDRRSILVYADWVELKGPIIMGTLSAIHVKGREVFSFEYDKKWLETGMAQNLDPDLQFYTGPQYLRDEKINFGMFLDSSPDRWGRVLMDRREAILARIEKRKSNSLFETDYLLGVYDGHRMGAIRFRKESDGAFLNNNEEMAAPPWASIRKLEEASLKLEEDNDDTESLKWLNVLIAPGSSLGGARPKASVLDNEGQLWIAKFPSANDSHNVGAWEKVTHDLATLAGLDVPVTMADTFFSKQHTFLSKRFDRTDGGARIHFASAMTLLGHTDGTNHQVGVSYLDLVEFIMKNGAAVDKDLEELWRRIVFYICVSNTDDHLRNHGFLRTDTGWTLSPAYDINPNEKGTGLNLNISEKDHSLDLNLALEVAPYFRLKQEEALNIIGKIKAAVSQWRHHAARLGISRAERDVMAKAFDRFSE